MNKVSQTQITVWREPHQMMDSEWGRMTYTEWLEMEKPRYRGKRKMRLFISKRKGCALGKIALFRQGSGPIHE